MISHRTATVLDEVELLRELDLNDPLSGLSSDEVEKRQRIFKPNELLSEDEDPIYIKFLEQFKDPLIMLLLCSAAISLLLKQFDDAISITLAVLIVGTVAFVQEYRSEQTLQALGQLVPPDCKVIRRTKSPSPKCFPNFLKRRRNMMSREMLEERIGNTIKKHRDGAVARVGARALVPGDVVALAAGDRVPADARLLHAAELQVDESSLTGEAERAEKTARPLPPPPLPPAAAASSTGVGPDNGVDLGKLKNLVFMGTLVCSGHGKAVVIATGMQTEFGKTFEEMKEVGARRTPLQVKMDDLGKQLSFISLGIIFLIALLGVLQGKNILDMFQIGVSLAVAAIPEGLPICVTVTLALGVMRMAGRQAVVKKLPAVEALGCATVVCCDKTGTLTRNAMAAEWAVLPGVEGPLRVAEEEGEGGGGGGRGLWRDPPGLPPLGATGGGGGGSAAAAVHPALRPLLETGYLCNNAAPDAAGRLHGQPTEVALAELAARAGLADPRPGRPRVHEVPFSSDTKMMEVRVEGGEGPGHHVKGDPARVLDACTLWRVPTAEEGEGELRPLTDFDRQRLLEQARALGEQGLRVLAGAYGQQVNALVFAGLWALRDPPRPTAPAAVAALRRSKVKLVMITGDAKETAVAIAHNLGFYDPTYNQAMSGNEVESMPRQTLLDSLDRVAVFYRVSPRHKLAIVRAFQELGEVVAMTGDGVNDAPALRAADIGVAMGRGGTDVAKEAADVVLLDDDLGTMVHAVEEGKSIFYNIKNFLTFQLSTSVAALSLIALSTVLGLPSPLNAMQILWINIIMDGPPAQSLGVEPVDPAVTSKPPRRPGEGIINKDMLLRVFSSGLLIVLGTLWVFRREMEDGAVTRRDTTMTFTCFVLFDMANALCCRSASLPVYKLDLFGNKAFIFAVGGSLVGQALVIYFPPLQGIFQTEALSISDLLYLALTASSLIVLDTARKLSPPLGGGGGGGGAGPGGRARAPSGPVKGQAGPRKGALEMV